MSNIKKDTIEYTKGADGKILWCWKCKEKIKKGEFIYLYRRPYNFICQKCEDESPIKLQDYDLGKFYERETREE